MNKLSKIVASCCFCIFLLPPLNSQSILINEFLASNQSVIADENGEYDDWVELYNAGTTAVDIGGMYLTDDLSDPASWQIPTTDPASTTIPPGGFLLLWFDGQPEQGVLHVDEKLGASGEDIGLYASDGNTPIDFYTFNEQLADVSEGRVPDGGDTFDFFGEPTPGSANDTNPGAPMTESPIVSTEGGIYSGSVTIELSGNSGVEIYYTLDGSIPGENSILYSEPIVLDQTTVLRAIAIVSPLLPSPVVTHTYLLDVSHTFAIVSISGEPADIFGPDGIYTDFEEDIEIPVNMEFYEPNGSLGFNQVVETEIQGTGSATLPQKSLAIKAKSSLGSDVLDYPIFDDLPYDQYRSLSLRNSGQDWNITMFRDAVVSSLVRDLSDIDVGIVSPDLYTQGFRPGVVYINGVYWGIHNIRERTDKRYLKVHFDLEEDEIDFLDEQDEVKEGDLDAWKDLQDFLLNNSVESEENFNELAEMVDLDAYLDYMVFNVFTDNTDWPGNNNRRWRERSTDGKWRWMVKDLDFTFGLFQLGGGWNTGDPTPNSLDRLLNPQDILWPNPEWSTRLFQKLVENDEWRYDFINRMADQINVLYDPERVNNRIDAFIELYQPEVQQHFDRWNGGWSGSWEPNIEKLRIFADGRIAILYEHFEDAFNELSGTSNITLNAIPLEGGIIEVNTITLDENHYPWQGTYFEGVPIPVEATPSPGYILESWSNPFYGNSTEIAINLEGNESITANFIKGSTETHPIVINEINYNSSDEAESGDWVELYNPNDFAVNMEGWFLEDESGNYFPFPAGTSLAEGAYLILVEDADLFSAVYPGIAYLGEFGKGVLQFGLSGGGERIRLKNADEELIDEVEYDDKDPWPEEADGDGPTLQLISPGLDNALPESWEAIAATPGALNGSDPVVFNQTINFPPIPDMLTTDPPFSVMAEATSGLPVSLIIDAGPASISGNTITLSGTTGTVIVRASQGGNANYNPAPDVVRSFNVIQGSGPNEYCASIGQQPWVEWISNVSFGTIDHNSFKEQYGDFTDQSTQVQSGQDYPISLTASFAYFTHDEYFRVWIDYNQDGIFQEPYEIAFSQILVAPPDGTPEASVNGLVSIPISAMSGLTRMRVSMKSGSYASPCETFDLGEVEDYSVEITAGGGEILNISCPTDIVVSAFEGSQSDPVNWDEAVANTTCSPDFVSVQQIQGPISGSNFPIGSTSIIYQASDDCNNVETCSFSVIVEAIALPMADLELQIDGPQTASLQEEITISFIIENKGPDAATGIRTKINWLEPVSGLEVISHTESQGSIGLISGEWNVGDLANGNSATLTITAIVSVEDIIPIYSQIIEVDQIDPDSEPDNSVAFIVTEDDEALLEIDASVSGNPSEYCISSGDQPWQEWIANVNFANINNSSFKDQYGDYTDQIAVVNTGQSYSISILPAFSWNQWDEYFSVWIDYNQDNDFGVDELVFSTIRPSGIPGNIPEAVTGEITIPETAIIGLTRMRVSMKQGAFSGPCELFTFGEVEDYSLTLISSEPSNRLSEQEAIYNLRVFPNPVHQSLQIDYATEHPGKMEIVLSNAFGEELHRHQSQIDMGSHRWIKDISQYPPGFYMAYLKMDGYRSKTIGFIRVGD